MTRVITEADKKYIRKHYEKMSDSDIAAALGRDKSAIQRTRKSMGLSVSKEIQHERRAAKLRGRTKCSPEQDQILRNNYLTVPKSKLAEMIGFSETLVVCRLRQLGLVIPDDILEERKQNSRIQLGSVPPNKGRKGTDYLSPEAIAGMSKTQFKKGSVPPNHKPVGYERITKNGYIEVKTGEGMFKFKLKHRLIWEQHNGPIPKGTNIQFNDRNPLNCDISNLYAIVRGAQMKQNSFHNWPKDLATTVQLRGVLNRKINKKLKQIKK